MFKDYACIGETDDGWYVYHCQRIFTITGSPMGVRVLREWHTRWFLVAA